MGRGPSYACGMELHLTVEQEAQLCRMAQDEGKTPEELIANAIFFRADEDSLFRRAVQRGLDQAIAGQFIDENEMQSRF